MVLFLDFLTCCGCLFFLCCHLVTVKCAEDEQVAVEVEVDGSIGSYPAPDAVFRQVPGPPPQQYWVLFENQSEEEVELYYDNGRDGVLQGKMPQKGDSLNIGTYVGHQFYFRRPNKSKRFFVTTMEKIITDITFRSEEAVIAEQQALKQERMEFMKNYKEEKGIKWLHQYPRPPPGLFMYPCENVGDRYPIISNYTHYHCYPQTANEEDHDACRDDYRNTANHLHYEWEVLSTHPKILTLHPRFLSDFEVAHVIELGVQDLNRSVTGAGGYENLSRTSSNAWVKRSQSDVLDWIFRRLAHVMQVDESHLWDTIGSESIQLVHYTVGQEYRAHHDWRVNRFQTRFATFLIYLNDQLNEDAGGETEFPKIGMRVHPGKGNVAMFYDLMEDGNVDDLTLHAALPVKQGEKWLANVWIWDPNFS